MGFFDLVLHGGPPLFSQEQQMVMSWNFVHVMFIIWGLFCACQKKFMTSSFFADVSNFYRMSRPPNDIPGTIQTAITLERKRIFQFCFRHSVPYSVPYLTYITVFNVLYPWRCNFTPKLTYFLENCRKVVGHGSATLFFL